VLACHGVGEGRGQAVAERLGLVAQKRPAALILSDGVDHEAASPGLAADAEERGEPGEEALDVTKAGAGAFHRRKYHPLGRPGTPDELDHGALDR
jgi:hypothetical protein